MDRSKLASFGISTSLFVWLAYTLLRVTAGFDDPVVRLVPQQLALATAKAQAAIADERRALPPLAARLAAQSGVAETVELLSALRHVSRAMPQRQERLAVLRATLDDAVSQFHRDVPQAFRVTVMDRVGNVLLSDSTLWAAGTQAMPGVKNIVEALRRQGAAASSGEALELWAEPVVADGGVIGAVVLERRIETAPAQLGVAAWITHGEHVMLGHAPEGFVATGVDAESFVLPRPTVATIDALRVHYFSGVFLAAERAGLWVRRSEIGQASGLWLYVALDTADLYDGIAGTQLFLLLMVAAVWLTHLLMIVREGRRLRTDITALADFLGRMHQGVGTSQTLSDADVVPALRRLARLITKTVERSGQPAAPPPLRLPPVSESVGESGTPDLTDLADAGRKLEPRDAAASSGPSPLFDLADLQTDADGYDGSLARIGQEVLRQETATDQGAATREELGIVGVGVELEPEPQEAADDVCRKVFVEFVALRQRCGEVGEVPFEAFRDRLSQSRAAVITHHGCRDVHFSVYVKNGKAALKATPAP